MESLTFLVQSTPKKTGKNGGRQGVKKKGGRKDSASLSGSTVPDSRSINPRMQSNLCVLFLFLHATMLEKPHERKMRKKGIILRGGEKKTQNQNLSVAIS
jgi:hypothetical protein